MTITDYNQNEVMDAFERGDYKSVLREALSHASAGNPAAQCMISLLYQCGYGVERNLTIAEEWLLKAAKQNYPLAWNNLGTLYAVGGEGLSQGREKSWECYTRAKELGFDGAEPFPPGASEVTPKLT
jgi:TPR repeat protein